MVLIIDNYDSFTYNLFQMIGATTPDMKVVRNDAVSIQDIREMAPSAIVLSPGPGKPSDAGICEAVVKELGGEIPILGVCLGHQAICEAFGGTVSYAKKLMHGKQSVAKVDNDSELFYGLSDTTKVARYHSLALKEETLPKCLKVTATADDGEIMAVQHKDYPIFGLQFHPESIMTPDGAVMLQNFLNIR
ncbi:MAG: aminodeoxychorismate/anthranilate synthase component II [Butyrivibrio sp.]|uniref:anthranilate synthase component II n=1 Tax=Butyrivibrio sp. TaxID=28121 RepID=UPI001B3DF8AF|nr:aminodeoxychorismate/anthranilate synthase component II [Butyrivibrio sp.]MBP3784713.1 aminodeoxychorismate/anthranilate synthase component II [Butyrivibrio sp.]MBP3815025.1 aminodeoxychorismate/anthranilate synthase component II [Butyrivibrio sp.]